MGFRVDKRLKLDKPTGHNYMSSKTRSIKVTNLDSDKIRANELTIENLKTGQVTAVVAVIYLSKDKPCNSRSAKRKPLAKDCQESASKSEKSKRLARIRQNVAMRDDLAKERGKASQSGTSESHDDISTSLKVKTKMIRVPIRHRVEWRPPFYTERENQHSYCEEGCPTIVEHFQWHLPN
jgi:hypothetical protein